MNILYFDENPAPSERLSGYLAVMCPHNQRSILEHRKSWDAPTKKELEKTGMILIAIPSLGTREHHPALETISLIRESGYTRPIVVTTVSEDTADTLRRRSAIKKHDVIVVSGRNYEEHIVHFLVETPRVLFLERSEGPDRPSMLAALQSTCVVWEAPDPSTALDILERSGSTIDGYVFAYDVPSHNGVDIHKVVLNAADVAEGRPIVIASSKSTSGLFSHLRQRRKSRGVVITLRKTEKSKAPALLIEMLLQGA